ncbi:MAG TPA: POTRA domain-containing protein, partial [Thermoanaerobaculia bacterium]|nr:POTRA domain-containing protein [Thermoanaerobaculia bacterium]
MLNPVTLRRGSRRWKITRRLLAALLLPLVLSGGIPARAQDPQAQAPQAVDGRTIESIELRGLKALPEDTLLYYLGLETGQPLDEEALNRSLKQLWDRNLIDDIAIEGVPTQTGVRLV